MTRAWFVGVPIAVALAVNTAIFSMPHFRSNVADPGRAPRLLPPGPVVGLVWTGLLAVMGLLMHETRHATRVAIAMYAAYCLAYPVLTSGLRNDGVAKALNGGALAGAALLGLVIPPRLKTWLLPLLAWTTYVNVVDSL